MTRLLQVLSLVVGVLVAAPAALACSCAIGDPRDMLERSDGAFVGTLVAREEVGDDQGLDTFQV